MKGRVALSVLRFFPFGISSEEKQEQTLISAAQRGNRSAFDALAAVHIPMLRGFLARRVGREAADDLLQETLLAVWTGLPGYTRRARFRSWMCAIAAHKCTDYFRRRGRTVSEVPLEFALDIADAQHSGFATLEWKQAIYEALRLLPAEQREVLELYYHAELSLPEVARALERNLNTVKYQFYRAHTLVERVLLAEPEVTPQRTQNQGKAAHSR